MYLSARDFNRGHQVKASCCPPGFGWHGRSLDAMYLSVARMAMRRLASKLSQADGWRGHCGAVAIAVALVLRGPGSRRKSHTWNHLPLRHHHTQGSPSAGNRTDSISSGAVV